MPSASPARFEKQSDESSFDQDEFAYLRERCSQKAEQSKLAAPVDHQSQQSARYADNRDNDGDNFQRVGDGEGAIENLDRLRTQAAIGEDDQVMTGRSFLHLSPDYFKIGTGRDVHSEIRRRGIGQIPEHGRAIDNDEALLSAVVVEDVDDFKVCLHAAQRQRNGVADAHVVLVGEWLADQSSIATAQLGVDHVRVPPREKSDSCEIVIARRVSRAE